jgi:hypothetical protein
MTPHIRCLQDTTTALENLVVLTTSEKLLWKPAPDRWSICEVLNHLTDVENLAVGLRAKRVVEEDRPLFVDYDRDARYAAGAYANDDGERALEKFHEARKASLAWLEEMKPSDWKRKGKHPAVGEVDLTQLLSLWAFHDLSHIRQVTELVKAVSFWDGIGSLQAYYSVQP